MEGWGLNIKWLSGPCDSEYSAKTEQKIPDLASCFVSEKKDFLF